MPRRLPPGEITSAAAWPGLVPLGFDDRFRRLWEYYLSYCEAGFLSGNIDVRQVIFAKQQ